MHSPNANHGRKLPLERETYLDERKLLIDAEREAARSFDKAMIALSGGALGLSITFLSHIAPYPQMKILVYLAWFCFSGALIVTLSSFLASQAAMRKQRQILDAYCDEQLSEEEKRNAWAASTQWLNVASIIFFIAGVAFLASFSMINLTRGDKTMSNQRSDEPLEEGYVPPIPPKPPKPQTPRPKPPEPPPPRNQ